MTYKIAAKYIKNINFNIPNAKTFFLLSKEISDYKINIEIKSKQIEKNIVEIEINLSLKPVKEKSEVITSSILYSVLIELEQVLKNKQDLEKIILIKVPNEVYPELRECFVLLFKKSGFNDVKIDNTIDFEKLYTKNKTQ